ncbi:MAG TPA: hypothetical protein VE010_01805, partial [Thermoanaerobaculia bacterium]|nr:hypothetical protein [Thermoanaerobaculia bacterium]
MTAMTRPSPLTIVVTLFFLGNAGIAVSAAYSRPAPSVFMALYWVGLGWAFAWWVLADCRARGTGSSIDHGWYV